MSSDPKMVSLDDLQAYVDEELTPERRAEVETHLAQSPDDAERVSAYRRQNRALRAALAGIGNEAVPAAMLAILQDRPPVREITWLPRVAAAFLFLAIGGALGGTLGWGYDKLPFLNMEEKRFLREAVAAHQVYAIDRRHAVEVAGIERDYLQSWLTQRLGVPIFAPDLSDAGLRLLGGRLISTVNGPAALLVYETDEGERVTCYITAEVNRLAPGKVFMEDEATVSLAWPTRHLAYAVSGAASRERLAEIAGMVNRELKQFEES
ncbi:MAG: anti-sigma factor [Kiloniellales bacterium]|nr:anti-sigma factor [Kiloniellales bacterium]